MRPLLLAVFTGLLLPFSTFAQDKTEFTLLVSGGKADLKDVPVRVRLNIGKEKLKSSSVDILEGGKVIAPGQLLTPAKEGDARELVFVLPELKAGATRTLQAKLLDAPKKAGSTFIWVKKEPGHTDLVLQGDSTRPVLRTMHAAFDDSSKEKRDRTYKVFHHLWGPDGKRFVTNGGHTDPHDDPKKLLFPHHRGLMFAFNRITYGGKKTADTWHATGDAHQTHEQFLREEAGPVLALQRTQVDWHGVKKEVFATEERQLTVYNLPGGTLIDVDLLLKTSGGKVRLDGDPQHAGFQFRASNDLVTQGNSKLTYYLRPDGKGKPGETRNWEPATKKGPVNLPWNVLSFVLDGQRFSVAYIDHPENPGEKRYSERDYGRFGCYFEYDLTEENPLRLRYRVWLQKDEMTSEQVEALRSAFITGPRVVVK